MKQRYDVAVFGSGFAGSLIAMIARRLGLKVILLERGRHPRVVIGESSTPLSNLLLETLADRYDLPFLKPLAKWGTWQRAYPEIGCGLKRGFSFFHHDTAGKDRPAPFDRQLLVAASPNDSIADTHWFRADFDQLLLQGARDLGVEYLDECEVGAMQRHGSEWIVPYRRGDTDAELYADFLIDATGPRGLLHRAFSLRELPLPDYPQTAALYSHFKGVAPYAGPQQYVGGTPPYPPDAAALHHVFDGGWMWVLHFNNGWTSAGVAATQAAAERLRLFAKESAWTRLLDTLPEVKRQFAGAYAATPFTFVPRLSFRSSVVTGSGWALLPSAAGFVDPLLSTGFPLTLLGISRLAMVLECDWKTTAFENSLAHYAAATDAELLATSQLIGALYANMADFPMFRMLSLLYFAAASYAETVRRLGKPELATSFLLHDDEVFGPELRRITARARHGLITADEKLRLERDIMVLIRRFDVAGLGRKPSDHCYPVRAEDLFAGAHTVHASVPEIESLLRRKGFSTGSSDYLVGEPVSRSG